MKKLNTKPLKNSHLLIFSKKTWNFLWNEDSAWSWLASILLAFITIRFLFYPLLGVLLGTSFPIVAVVSESMEHGTYFDHLCGEKIEQFHESFDNYWEVCGDWYENNGISKQQFLNFPFKNGFDKGDVIILWRANPDNIQIGDILVFKSGKPQPIIHRVVDIQQENGKHFYQTKGDHNSGILSGDISENRIEEERILGKGLLRIPYLGWTKIIFVDAVRPFGINIQR